MRPCGAGHHSGGRHARLLCARVRCVAARAVPALAARALVAADPCHRTVLRCQFVGWNVGDVHPRRRTVTSSPPRCQPARAGVMPRRVRRAPPCHTRMPRSHCGTRVRHCAARVREPFETIRLAPAFGVLACRRASAMRARRAVVVQICRAAPSGGHRRSLPSPPSPAIIAAARITCVRASFAIPLNTGFSSHFLSKSVQRGALHEL
ncbi:hypothetical protein A33M_3529 [Rhodovulum sp. PH10]|nr:hypothetical protein A33M_3529 [Rhodovulum sp. PH10]